MEDVGESKSGIYDDVKNIPQINKIKENGEKELNDSMLLESSKKYLEDLKSYKGGSDEHWVQGFYNNKHFSIEDVEANGDCFFATLREAFKSLGVLVSVGTMRNILSKKVSKEDFKYNRTVFVDTYKALRKYQKDYKAVSAN